MRADVSDTAQTPGKHEFSSPRCTSASGRNRFPQSCQSAHRGAITLAAGKEADAKYSKCAIQNARFTLVNNAELYDLTVDPGKSRNVIAEHPEIGAQLRAAYDKWWSDVQPLLDNEDAVGPKIKRLKELYCKQFGGGPDAKLLERMDPQKKFDQPAKAKPKADRRKKRQEAKAK